MLEIIKKYKFFILVILLLFAVICKQQKTINNNNNNMNNYITHLENFENYNKKLDKDTIDLAKYNLDDLDEKYKQLIDEIVNKQKEKEEELKNEIKFWTKKFCPDCEHCPQFRNGLLLYKDLSTPYIIEFPNYEHLNKKSKDILIALFGEKQVPEPSRDREFFPYNLIDKKIDMDNVIPTMA